MGLHYRFWHASEVNMRKMRYRGGHTPAVQDMAKTVLTCCKECSNWARAMTRPMVKANLSEHFNYRVQCDLFFLWESPIQRLHPRVYPRGPGREDEG